MCSAELNEVANWAEIFMAGTRPGLLADGRAGLRRCNRLEHHDRDVAGGCQASVFREVRPEPLGDEPVVPFLVPADLTGVKFPNSRAVLKSSRRVGYEVGVPGWVG